MGGRARRAWMGWARDLTDNNQRGLVTLALPSLLAAGLVWKLRRREQGAGGESVAAGARG